MSRHGLLRPAAAVYDRCRRQFPQDDYSHHYFAWNLEKAGERSDVVRTAYEAAVQLAPAHVWWNARLVQYLIRGHDPEAARVSWTKALENVDPDGAEVSRSVYVAEHLHLWVADEWLARGCWQAALRTLAAIPLEMRTRLGVRYSEAEDAARSLEASELVQFGEWLEAQRGEHWDAARSWWGQARQALPQLPAPAGEESVEGGAILTWSLPTLYVDVEFSRTGTMHWYGSERPVRPDCHQGEEDIPPTIPDALRFWLERAAST